QPSEISYLPDVPEYIKNNSTYWTKKKISSPSSTFLIIQHDLAAPDRESAWRNKFEKASVEVINLPWNTTVEKINSFAKLRK
ncbi:MAG TPA: hypothetical protein VLH94_00255, partial [Spirochaetia bacterium]|nr:hypothetical protein [Spirochaetia bacterium]